MKRIFLVCFAAVSMIACKVQSRPELFQKEDFKTVIDGAEVSLTPSETMN